MSHLRRNLWLPKVITCCFSLGRLLFETCKEGYNVEGNELSYHQLIASSWVLNQTHRAEQYTLFPFVSDFSNVVSRADQLQMVKIPDVHPATALAATDVAAGESGFDRMRMTAGEFTELYNATKYKDHFNAVATVYFVDTAPNMIRYIQTVHNCLKSGGIWINLGPLLWHFVAPPNREWADGQHGHKSAGVANQRCVELSDEEVLMLLQKFGFEVEEKEVVHEGSGYIQNPNSMLQSHCTNTSLSSLDKHRADIAPDRSSHWVAKKVA